MQGYADVVSRKAQRTLPIVNANRSHRGSRKCISSSEDDPSINYDRLACDII